jgi:hypothetical protein
MCVGKPNLFLVGPPKCGTTAVSEYLRSHPDIYFSDPKEPNFFCPDVRQQTRPFRTLDAYLSLFEKTSGEHYVAEGSASYIISAVAIQDILDFNSNARFIAFVRNPIDQCHSLHRQLVNSEREDIRDFERAWRLQEERAQGRCLPQRCRDPMLLQYRYVASMGTLLQRFMGQVPSGQRYVVVFDDLRADAAKVYANILDFLNLPHDGRTQFPVINPAWEIRWPAVSNFVRRPPAVLRLLSVAARRLNEDQPLGIYRRLDPILRRGVPMTAITPRLHAELVDTFHEEIALLSDLLKRDFSSWLIPGQACSA